MSVAAEALSRLAGISGLSIRRDVSLAEYTRFALGGPAEVFIDAPRATAFQTALELTRGLKLPSVVIGGGTNLVVSDGGFAGVVLRYTGSAILRDGECLTVESGALLQDVVDFAIAGGLGGLETMTGIPGWTGGAVYGNAGAYGHSIQEVVECVRATDGESVTEFSAAECEFRYRESIFKSHKTWVILSTDLRLRPADPLELRQTAAGIRTIRDEKYPPSMKCAGSIFKNLLFAQLPPHVQSQVPPQLVREGKVPSAWFLEQTGAKGMRRGGIQVASYHANLICNDGGGMGADLVALISELKKRVRDRFGFELEEEVQYIG
jgi:UDP-N-acetylmuramate dehydrogenase